MTHTLGIEFGSTRIKAVLIDEAFRPVASGDYTWKSDLRDGVWTYDLEEAWNGLRTALRALGEVSVDAMGISAMMHGYLAFDKDWNLLVPFRTWQNTITADAAEQLTQLFQFNVPQRWSIAHLYQAILNGEPHVSQIAHITTLSSYVHYMLTGENVVGVGEASGRLEEVLRSLGVYYDEEDRLFAKIRSSVGYPAALLCIMSIILAFTVIIILPVFEDVYVSMAGSLTDGSSGAVGVSVAIGWVALGITLICAIVAVGAAIACRSEAGRIAVMHLMEKFPATRPAMEQLAVSRFASALAAYTASGINTDEAMRRAIDVVEHEGLKAKATAAYGLMIDAESPRSLAQAISEAEVFEQIHARLLTIGTRSGSLDAALDRLSANFFDDAILQIDAAIDNIEPALAAFLTIAVGATLISVMLPLIGIMGSIG